MVTFSSILQLLTLASALATTGYCLPVAVSATSTASSAAPSPSCSADGLKIENDWSSYILVQVWMDNPDWDEWTWQSHTQGDGQPVPGMHQTQYNPGDRFDIDGTYGLGSFYILQALVPGGCGNVSSNYYTAYRGYNGACDVFHFGTDCNWHNQ